MDAGRLQINMKFDIVVPITERDVVTVLQIAEYWKKYLPIKKIVFIGNRKVGQLLGTYPYHSVEFINEDNIIEYAKVEQIIKEYTHGNEEAIRRTGWYLQQFLKMEYFKYCEDEYYMIWDSDTAPLKKVDMFKNGKPVFHLKDELRESYFVTLSRIFEGFHKIIAESFISEHMLIKCDIMRKLVKDIGDNDSLAGDSWYEKVIRAIDIDEVAAAGFSEFETYGTYCTIKFPEAYEYMTWKSYRGGGNYFDLKTFDEDQASWLAKEFDAISFEKVQIRHKRYAWFTKRIVQKLFRFSQVVYWVGALDEIEKRIKGNA